MFDWYQPRPLTCPLDGVELRGWQGKEGPCDDETFAEGTDFSWIFGSRDTFEMHTSHPLPGLTSATWRERHYIEALGFLDEAGIWISSRVVNVQAVRLGAALERLWNLGDGTPVLFTRHGTILKEEQ